MRAITMNKSGGPEVLTLAEIERPIPSENEVLIETRAAGVNGPDLMQRKGLYPPPEGASPLLGLEVAGTIVSAPKDSKFKKGDAVCALVHGGGYAQYCVAPVGQCLPIPKGLSFEEAAAIPETFFTVWANVFQIGRLKKGESILIHGGSGGIGSTAIQLARAFGAEVYATAGDQKKAKLCETLGAKKAIVYATQDFEEFIEQETVSEGVNLILDIVGGHYTNRNLSSLAPAGRLVQIAAQQGAEVNIDLFKIMQKRLVITGSLMRPRSIEDKAAIAKELFQKVWPLLEEKKVKVLLNQVFPLKEVSEAHAYLESGKNVGKIVLTMPS